VQDYCLELLLTRFLILVRKRDGPLMSKVPRAREKVKGSKRSRRRGQDAKTALSSRGSIKALLRNTSL
jgi:hypothetical protein